MYKDIIVCVNESEGRDNTLRAAARMANDLNANLTGLYVRTADTAPNSALFGFVSDQLLKEATMREDERVARAKASFDAIVEEAACYSSWLVTSEYNHPLKAIAYADLVITDQVAFDPRQGRSNIGFINNLIIDTGKPVILIPADWDKPLFGSNIILAWNESREAGRAMQDALPLLQKAEHVEAVSVNYKDKEAVVDISEISTYLTRRNVVNSFKLAATDDELGTPEKVLLDRAKKRSADLIVAGGYGHTRLREIVLGGVSRYLTQHAHVPVLFSH